jgi:hypothetical protein
MNHGLLEPEKKKPANEQTLRERYPNVDFSSSSTLCLANLTLNEFIKKMPENPEAAQIIMMIKGSNIESYRLLFSFHCLGFSECNPKICYIGYNPELFCDVLIEAAKENHSQFVGWLLRRRYQHAVETVDFKYLIEKYINAMIIGSGSSISDSNLGNRNILELMLCAHDTPTELLEIISDKKNRIIFKQNTNECTSYILNWYFDFIVENLKLSEEVTYFRLFCGSDEKCKKYIDKQISNLEFLCDVIEKYFINSEGLLQEAKKLCSRYENILCQYNPQVKKVLPLLFNSAQSVEQEKDNAPTISSKQKF